MKKKSRKLSKKEINFITTISSPEKVQNFIDSLKYNSGDRIAIIDVIKYHKADCLEAACFATLCLKDSFIMDLECNSNDDDHVICVYKKNGLYGAVAQSKYLGLKQRNPVYKTLRELAMSYFDNYFNYDGEFDLSSRSIPLKIKKEWIFSLNDTLEIEKKLTNIRHIKLVPKLKLPIASKEKFHRELLILPRNINNRYK
ncbi:MAG: hypothetical protein ACMXYG_06395 [Candidatus Woesearchaeota archaeon]